MDLRQLTPDLAVSPQIEPADVPALAQAGFRMLINNRPDPEVDAGHGSAVMEQAAKAAGMAYAYIPFVPGEVHPDMIAAQAEALRTRPAIAYCRSGNRCTVLWALGVAGQRPAEEILSTASAAGYDLTPVLPLIEALAGRDRG